MKTSWNFLGACSEGQRFEIEGLDVWSRSWTRAKEALSAEVKDPRYGQSFTFPVYQIEVGSKKTLFAAGEFSNSMFGFYVPKK
jgi:hypothetical protein